MCACACVCACCCVYACCMCVCARVRVPEGVREGQKKMARGRASRTHHSLGNTERRKIEICEHSVAVHPQHKALAGVLRVGLEQVAKDHDLGPSRVAVARMAVPAHDLPGRQDRRRQGAGHGLAHAAAPACARPPARARRTRPPHAPAARARNTPPGGTRGARHRPC